MSTLLWKKFRKGIGKRLDEASEPIADEFWSSLRVYAPDKPPKAVLLFTRSYLCDLWLKQDEYPNDVLTLIRYGIPTRAYWKLIRDITAQTRLPICFIGDLDPQDLTAFVGLRCGDPDLTKPNRRALPVEFLGIEDTWLELCDQYLLPKWQPGGLFWKMPKLELEHRDVILRIAPWLLDLVGPRCAEALRSGLKLELEGASNPAFFGKSFTKKVLRHILNRAKQLTRAQA